MLAEREFQIIEKFLKNCNPPDGINKDDMEEYDQRILEFLKFFVEGPTTNSRLPVLKT